MNWKEFFWATKEKTVLTIALFLLLNILIFPTFTWYGPCDKKALEEAKERGEILQDCEIVSPDIGYEIVYFGFSFLASCIVFYFLKKGGKKNA